MNKAYLRPHAGSKGGLDVRLDSSAKQFNDAKMNNARPILELDGT